MPFQYTFRSIDLESIKTDDRDLLENRDRELELHLANIGTFTVYTPTWTAVSGGTGPTNAAQYSLIGNILFLRLRYTLGTGGSLTGSPSFSLPSGMTLATNPTHSMLPSLQGAAAGSPVGLYPLWCYRSTSSTIGFVYGDPTGTYLDGTNAISATAPFTWGTGDAIEAAGWVQVA